ncbi:MULTISPECIES: hypothetical protein [Streptomyces]|uniref:Uncharacterized protein n=2 Tax=Streptomyces TaxID=1883 RepID=A0A1E7LJQ6_9ACTN|nr:MULTISPECIES: hypothetical protein [Streptomyces]OEV16439.1 hypothetical protein AN221_33215 [Streptomyces nanshensis]POG49581.1 hypothetical protein BV881_01495 [Streptomyces sp. ZL-24]
MHASAGQLTHAEIRRVWPRDGHIRILGTVLVDGVPDEAPVDNPWTLRLTSRERPEVPLPTGVKRLKDRLVRTVSRTSPPTRRRLHFPAVSNGADFEAVVAVRDVAVWDALPREHWDVDVIAVRNGKRLVRRVGGHLDDMPGKKQIVKYPEQYHAGVAVLPYFTDGDDLSIRCARRDNGNGGAA